MHILLGSGVRAIMGTGMILVNHWSSREFAAQERAALSHFSLTVCMVVLEPE